MNEKIRNTLAVFTETFEQIDISEEDLLEASVRIGFIHLFANVKDFRQQGKIRYKLSNILFLIFLVKVKEKTNSFEMIAGMIKVEKDLYEKYGLIEDGNCPSHDTLRRIMMILDADAVYEETVGKFYDFLCDLEKEIKGRDTYRHIAVDGKEVCGSGRKEGTKNPSRNSSLLNVYDSGLATCIHSIHVDDKTNEIPVGQEILSRMRLTKTVVTADALHCQKNTADIISRKKGIYILTVKENQPWLYEDIMAKLNNPDNKNKIKSYNRDDRVIDIFTLHKAYDTDGFTGMKAFIRMSSCAGKKKCERYFIANTTDPDIICEGIEARWKIENVLHKEKDTYMNEDAITYTNKNAIKNMVIFNNLAVQISRMYQAFFEPDLYIAKLTFHAHPFECINKLLTVMESEEIVNRLKSALRKASKK